MTASVETHTAEGRGKLALECNHINTVARDWHNSPSNTPRFVLMVPANPMQSSRT